MTRIRIAAGSCRLTAELNDTHSARAVLAALPCVSTAKTWGDEVYFEIGVEADLEPDATDVVDPGTVCLWVEGRSLAIPFGPTPSSKGNECRLVTRVNLVGQTVENPSALRHVRDGDPVRVEVFER